MEKEKFIQIGVTALRAPNGDFLPTVPLYVKAKNNGKNLTKEEEELLKEVGRIYSNVYKKQIKEE